MIKYYGVFQLVKVTKEGKTKNGEKMVYFTAASQRSKDDTDFKLFKMFKKNAERFLDNLEKQGDKYKSRKMMIEGYVETYKENQEVECEVSVKKDKLPEKYGTLIKNVKVIAKTTIKVDKDVYVVNNFEFLDKKGVSEVNITDADDEDEGTYYADDDEDGLEAAATSGDKNINKRDSINISKMNSNSLNIIDKFNDNVPYGFTNVQDMT